MSDRTSRNPERPPVRMGDGLEPDVTPSEARQGVKGHNARYVLTIGTIGVVVLFAIVYFLFFLT